MSVSFGEIAISGILFSAALLYERYIGAPSHHIPNHPPRVTIINIHYSSSAVPVHQECVFL